MTAPPREPTPEMLAAAGREDPWWLTIVWQAMYDAAPAPSAEPPDLGRLDFGHQILEAERLRDAAPAPSADSVRVCPVKDIVCSTPDECGARETGCKMLIRVPDAAAQPAEVCGDRGFAGPSCCALPSGHLGEHKYGTTAAQPAEPPAHKPGCPATGGYGHGKEPCICGAEPPATDDLVARLNLYQRDSNPFVQKITREAAAELQRQAREIAAANRQIAGLQDSLRGQLAGNAELNAERGAMARELLELRGSFPAPKHEHFYDAARAKVRP